MTTPTMAQTNGDVGCQHDQHLMKVYLNGAVEIENVLGFSILTKEAELLWLVKTDPDRHALIYRMRSGLSPRGFTAAMGELLNAGLIERYPCSENPRKMRLK